MRSLRPGGHYSWAAGAQALDAALGVFGHAEPRPLGDQKMTVVPPDVCRSSASTRPSDGPLPMATPPWLRKGSPLRDGAAQSGATG